MNCTHDNESRTEITHLCNIRHANNDHLECDEEKCGTYRRDDCPHIFGFQVCDCGQKFVGKLGDYHEDTLENLEEKL